jgi:hypothetical protein
MRVFAKRRAKNMLIHIFGEEASEEVIQKGAKQLVKAVGSKGGILESMKPKHLRQFLIEADPVYKELLDDLGTTAVGNRVLREAMDESMEKIAIELTEINVMKDVMKNTMISLGGRLGKASLKPRHWVAAAAAIYALRMESMEQKFRPYGTNSIVLKTPYTDAVVYDELPVQTKEQADSYFENFGTLGKQGMLPETKRYFLSLTRDKKDMWWDQEPQRFNLVSPCYANIRMKVTRCECESHEDIEGNLFWTGENYMMPNGKILNLPHFDGETPMTYSFMEEGNYVKRCYSSSFWRDDTTTKPLCIQIDPVLKDVDGYNYCYHGTNTLTSITKATLTVVEVATPIILEAACIAAGTGGAIGGGAIGFGVGAVPGGSAAYIACKAMVPWVSAAVGAGLETTKAYIDTQHMWPNHD